MNDYPLIYVRKNDNRIFHAKRIIPGHYSLICPLTGEKTRITKSRLKNEFEFQDRVSMGNVRRSSQPILIPRAI
jgi:hypothetical protein